MITLTVRISRELNLLIEEFCKEEDRSKSWFTRKALEEKLEERQNGRCSKTPSKNKKIRRIANTKNL